jgi:hypothetical protein
MPPLVSPSQDTLQPNPNWSGFDDLILAAFTPPTPANSWLRYRPGYYIEVESNVVLGVTLPNDALISGQPQFTHWDSLNSPTLPTGVQNDSIFNPMAEVIAAAQAQQQGGTGSEVFAQQRASPIVYVYLIGDALRMGFPIPMPEILLIGGQKPVLCNRADRGEGFTQKIVGENIAPVFGASWKLRYAFVAQFPACAMPVPPDYGLT